MYASEGKRGRVNVLPRMLGVGIISSVVSHDYLMKKEQLD